MADVTLEWEEWSTKEDPAYVIPEETRTEWAQELMAQPHSDSVQSGDSIVICSRRLDGTVEFIDALVRRTATVHPAEPPPKATP